MCGVWGVGCGVWVGGRDGLVGCGDRRRGVCVCKCVCVCMCKGKEWRRGEAL